MISTKQCKQTTTTIVRVTITGRRDLDHLHKILSEGEPPAKGGNVERLVAQLPSVNRITITFTPEQWLIVQTALMCL